MVCHCANGSGMAGMDDSGMFRYLSPVSQLTCNTKGCGRFNIQFKICYSNRKLQDSTVQDTKKMNV